MELEFRTKNPKQLQAAEFWIDNEVEQLLYGGAKGGGKSFLGANLIFGDALIYPGTHYFIARQELTDLRSFTLPTIYEVFKNWGIKFEDYCRYNDQSHIFFLTNGSQVHFIACKEMPGDPLFERFGSMQMTRGWIEEGGEISEAAKANLWLSIGRWKNDVYKLKKKLLITANPKKGWMKREFVDPARESRLESTKRYVQAFATDNAYLPEDYIKTLREEKDKVRKQRLFEGNWDYDEDLDSIVSYEALEDAFTNTIIKDNQKYMIVDVARFGEDTTVFSFWDGLELYKIEQRTKQDIEMTKQKIKDYAAEHKIPYSNIMIDEDGVGGGVVDGLPGVKGFVANSTALPTATEIRSRKSKIENSMIPKRNFYNLKSQCGWKLAELINEHKVAFRVHEYREKLIAELDALLREKEIDSDRKLALKPKKEVKEALGMSPDVGDTVIMRAWFELRKLAIDEDPNKDRVIQVQKEQFVINRGKINSNK